MQLEEQLSDMTFEQFINFLQTENNPAILQEVAATLASDLKTTKRTLLQICEMFGLAKDGQFVEKVDTKAVIGGIMSTATDALSPFKKKAGNENKFAFLSEIVTVSKKYKNF